MYRVFTYKGSEEARVDKLISDDRVQTLSVSRIDGKSLDIDGKVILFEGNPENLEKVLKQVDIGFMEEVKGDKATAAYKKIKDDENEAAGGLGFVFQ